MVQNGIDFSRMMGWSEAADHFDHYIGNTGGSVGLIVGKAANDVPAFKRALEVRATNTIVETANQAVADGRFDCPIPFVSEWEGFNFRAEMSQNWFLAVAGAHIAVTGFLTVHDGSPPRVEVTYQSHLADRYNFDGDKNCVPRQQDGENGCKHGKFAKIWGPISVEDEAMADLVRAGLAREYDMRGTTDITSEVFNLGTKWAASVSTSPGSR